MNLTKNSFEIISTSLDSYLSNLEKLQKGYSALGDKDPLVLFLNERIKNIDVAKKEIESLYKPTHKFYPAPNLYSEEWKLCSEDPLYFINHYVLIRGPSGYSTSMTTTLLQENLLNWYLENNSLMLKKERQKRITTATVAYALWCVLFKPDQNFLFVSHNYGGANRVMDIFRQMYDGLPRWMKIPIKKDNKLNTTLNNGSKFQSVSGNMSSFGCGENYTTAVFDEAAFIKNLEEIYQTISFTKQIIMYSSENPDVSWFGNTTSKSL